LSRRVALAVQIGSLALVVGTLATVLVAAGRYFALSSLFATVAIALCLGYQGGTWAVIRAYRKVDRELKEEMEAAMEAMGVVACVGGPLDGSKLPRPPLDPDENTDVFIATAGHPEGRYRFDGELLEWEEPD
jgi:hypothetical protein